MILIPFSRLVAKWSGCCKARDEGLVVQCHTEVENSKFASCLHPQFNTAHEQDGGAPNFSQSPLAADKSGNGKHNRRRNVNENAIAGR